MPTATCDTSASTISQRFAIALMNEIFVARNAFDAYLIISADAGSVTSIGASTVAYSALTRTVLSGSSHPMTMRFGLRKSCTAWPSRRNSGFDATETPSVGAPDSDSTRCTKRVEPTGTVDLLITTAPGRSTGAISRRDRFDERHVRRTVLAERRRDAQEDELGVVRRGRGANHELQAAACEAGLDELGQAVLEDRDLPLAEAGDAIGVDVSAGHVVTEVRQARGCRESDVAGTHHGDVHRLAPSCGVRGSNRPTLDVLSRVRSVPTPQ